MGRSARRPSVSLGRGVRHQPAARDIWLAQRRDNREMLSDQTPLGLRDRILADYTARPVSRDVIPPASRSRTKDERPLPDLPRVPRPRRRAR